MKGNFTATENDSIIVPANEKRNSLIIQLHSGDPTAISIGIPAIFAQGIRLINAGDWTKITGLNVKKAIHAICDTGNSSTGGYQS